MVWLLLLFITTVAGNIPDWDLLIFTQQWPNTACLDYEESGSHHVCILPQTSPTWTVHGIWPTKLHTEGPGFCNKSAKFDPELLKPLINELKSLWPTIELGKDDSSFWKHEWLKHGTCASVLEPLNSEEKYFSKGLNWFHQYNMTRILNQNGIVPSDSILYDVGDIHAAVVSEIKTNPRIVCSIEKYTKLPYLMELRICFDKELNPADCDGTMLGRKTILGASEVLTNCPQGVLLRYPRNVPPIPKPKSPVTVRYSYVTVMKDLLNTLTFLNWLI